MIVHQVLDHILLKDNSQNADECEKLLPGVNHSTLN